MASFYTLSDGCPLPNSQTSVQVRNGSGGGLVLLQDTALIETLAHFNRERIPERVVHAKAAGAYGEFECTHDCTDITSASFLSKVGKKSDVLLRISTVGPERGSADTTRDVHGWGMKIYTDEGNQDFVFNDIPVFFIRDPIKFPSLNRSHKRDPRTNLSSPNMFWDFHVGSPEGIHAIMNLFSDRGTPASLRAINAYSGHTYKFTKENGTFKYVKIHIKSQLGFNTLDRQTATKIAGENPDFLTQDLFEAIQKGDYPVYDVFVQVMDPKDAESYKWNIFDMTKVWPHKDYPLRQIGRLTLNRNPRNYFTDIEQAAFSPSTIVPGIAPSADPGGVNLVVLQARMFAYPDAARYRLGVNYQFLPTNRSQAPVYSPFQRDGFMNFTENYGDDPNYVGSMLRPTAFKPAGNAGQGFKLTSTFTEHEKWVGEVTNYTTEVGPEDFEQATAFWEVLGRQPGQQDNFVGNVAEHISGTTSPELRTKVYELFSHVDKELASRIRDATKAALRK
ncbi:Catalase [Cladobotryum mycophilum]|uniref:Catalase n=1 Tax=Cladobotryum mycophilum TaxID=491253 RepID=A0ABR0SA63_9HYPO